MRTEDSPQAAASMAEPQARTEAGDAPLQEVRLRRRDLHAVIVDLEEAIARPAGRSAEWAERVHEALIELGAEFERHIAATEAPGGLFDAVNAAAPRLANQTQVLAGEHQDIRAAIGRAIDAVRPRAHPLAPADASGGREDVLALLTRLLRHRQAGADLVYEAFETDIGGGD